MRARRNLTFFWAGRVVPRGHLANPMYAAAPNVRTELLRLATSSSGPFAENNRRFVVVDSAQAGLLDALPDPHPHPNPNPNPNANPNPNPTPTLTLTLTPTPTLTLTLTLT